MIPAQPGWRAHYESKEGREFWEDVIAFDEEGRALTVDRRTGRLEPAARFNNFKGINFHGDLIQLIPADGWILERESEGRRWTSGIVGWGLKSNGDVVPLESDSEGYVSPIVGPRSSWRLLHRDDRDEPDPERE